MKNCIKIDDKIGYLNLRTGRYMFSTVIGINETDIKLRTDIKQSKNNRFINEFKQKTEDIIKWLKEPSIDWKDGRPLLKHKSINKNYTN